MAVCGRKMASTIVKSIDNRIVRAAQARRCLDDGLKYRLQIELGARDDTENIADGGLVLKRFLQLAFARLLRLEQPRIFDGDRCLVGEAPEELDLALGEGPDLSTADRDST